MMGNVHDEKETLCDICITWIDER